MKRDKYLLLIFCTLFGTFVLKSQTMNLSFEQITVKNGMSHNRTQAVLKDSEGFIWIGTLEGLNKYDGSNITIYKNDEKNPKSISDNKISSLFEDADSVLWIGTGNGGLNKFDKKTGTFSNYLTCEYPDKIKSKYVRSIASDNEGYLWLGTNGGGLTRFDKRTNTYVHHTHNGDNNNSLANNIVFSVVANGDEIWVATSGGGLDVLNKRSNIFKHYVNSKQKGSLSNNSVYVVYKDSKGRIWVGTDFGLNLYNPVDDNFTSYYHQDNTPNSLCNNRVLSISEDNFGRLWLATKDGLSCVSILNDKEISFVNIKKESANENSISRDDLLSVFADNTNILWIGTFNGGINKAFLEEKQFTHLNHEVNNTKSLSQNVIRSIYEDRDKNLWVGTDGGGLDKQRYGTSNFVHYQTLNSSETINNNQTLAIEQDRYGDIWVGTWGGGLSRLNYKNINSDKNDFIKYTNNIDNKKSIVNNIIQDIFEDRDGRLWIGTEGGLCLYNRSTNDFELIAGSNDRNYLSDNRIQSNTIFQDSEGDIWVGTWNGLNKMVENKTDIEQMIEGIKVPPKSIRFIHYLNSPNDSNTISDNRIISINEDSNNTLWIGTYGRGLNRYDKTNGRFDHFFESDGLANNVVYGILEDNAKNLWLSTNNGMSRYSLKTNSFRNYDESDGLQSNYFYWGAAFKLRNGNLAFGGTNGLTIFNPQNIKDNQHIPPVYIIDFQINNQPVPYSQTSTILTTPIWCTKEITLPFSKDLLTFEFIALNFIHSEKNNYSYKMEGFNDEWVEAGTKRSATYTNLAPGHYTFRVRGSNNDGVWNQLGASINIIITPPYWATWWFRMVIVLVLIAMVSLFFYLKIRRIALQAKKLKQKVEERTQELNEANSTLFTLNNELNEVNILLEETNEEITEQKELVIHQRDEIEKKNYQLELHRNHLEELVTERTIELLSAKEKAEESERLKAAFLANMSHEIRTPLNAIVGFSSLLAISNLSAEEKDDFNFQISSNTESLMVLIDDILDLSLIEAKQAMCYDQQFNVTDFLENFFKYWYAEHNTNTRAVILNNKVTDPNLTFFSDEHKIRQILSNIMGNACKFTETGFIELGFERKEQMYVFYVKDSGIGIEKKNLEVIFDWFRKIEEDNSKLYRGTGLGLAISIRLAKILGGNLWVDSEYGKGSTFYFSIPETVATIPKT